MPSVNGFADLPATLISELGCRVERESEGGREGGGWRERDGQRERQRATEKENSSKFSTLASLCRFLSLNMRVR